MTNGRGGTAMTGGVIRAVARQYGWKAFALRSVREVSLLLPMRGNLSFETPSDGRFGFAVQTGQAQNPKLTVTRVAE